MFNKKKLDNFLKQLRKTKELAICEIDYMFVTKGTAGNDGSCCNISDSESCRRGIVQFVFVKEDGFEKWVDVFVEGESKIHDAESLLIHYKSIPDDFEYLSRNIERAS